MLLFYLSDDYQQDVELLKALNQPEEIDQTAWEAIVTQPPAEVWDFLLKTDIYYTRDYNLVYEFWMEYQAAVDQIFQFGLKTQLDFTDKMFSNYFTNVSSARHNFTKQLRQVEKKLAELFECDLFQDAELLKSIQHQLDNTQ